MEKKNNIGFLIGSIASALISFPTLIISLPFLIIGTVFSISPSGAEIYYNGEQLQGEAAMEVSRMMGHIFLIIGGCSIGTSLIFALLFIILLVLFLKKKS